MIDFTRAHHEVINFLSRHGAELGTEVVVLRDLRGIIRFFVHIKSVNISIFAELSGKIGKYSPGVDNFLLSDEDFIDPNVVWRNPDLVELDVESSTKCFLLERQLSGLDWTREPITSEKPPCTRLAMFGIKGGVGRSMATAMLARHLARLQKKVLVVDFDLESPGIGFSLLPQDRIPRYGVVDWFVEDAVGQSDEIVKNGDIFGISPIGENFTRGEIFVVPSVGENIDLYVSKLSRIQIDVEEFVDGRDEVFAGRFGRFISTLENVVHPDVTIIDSRAGIHDSSAIAVLRLNATALLFAVNSYQTWRSYNILFNHWKNFLPRKILATARDNLQIVSSFIPETGRDEYISSCLESSYKLFQENLYDEEAPGDTEAFNFDINCEFAPHYPWKIFWNRYFMTCNVSDAELDENQCKASYNDFLESITEYIYGTDKA